VASTQTAFDGTNREGKIRDVLEPREADFQMCLTSSYSNIRTGSADLRPDRAIRILFLVGAAVMAAIALYALWKPKAVFDNVRAEDGADGHPVSDMKRLLGHWPIYPALLIWLRWNFAPGSTTPLQYHLQNALHATDAQWGQWNAIFAASFIPTFIVYGLLSRRYPLKTLLLWERWLPCRKSSRCSSFTL
jgi:hypothetical protein